MWDDQDERKHRAPQMSIEEVQKRLDEQAALTPQKVMVKAIVLNAAIRERNT